MLKKVNLRYLVPVILIALVVAILLRTFVVQAYKVSTPSMEEALLAGEFFLVNKLAYKFKGSTPRPNDCTWTDAYIQIPLRSSTRTPGFFPGFFPREIISDRCRFPRGIFLSWAIIGTTVRTAGTGVS